MQSSSSFVQSEKALQALKPDGLSNKTVGSTPTLLISTRSLVGKDHPEQQGSVTNESDQIGNVDELKSMFEQLDAAILKEPLRGLNTPCHRRFQAKQLEFAGRLDVNDCLPAASPFTPAGTAVAFTESTAATLPLLPQQVAATGGGASMESTRGGNPTHSPSGSARMGRYASSVAQLEAIGVIDPALQAEILRTSSPAAPALAAPATPSPPQYLSGRTASAGRVPIPMAARGAGTHAIASDARPRAGGSAPFSATSTSIPAEGGARAGQGRDGSRVGRALRCLRARVLGICDLLPPAGAQSMPADGAGQATAAAAAATRQSNQNWPADQVFAKA